MAEARQRIPRGGFFVIAILISALQVFQVRLWSGQSFVTKFQDDLPIPTPPPAPLRQVDDSTFPKTLFPPNKDLSIQEELLQQYFEEHSAAALVHDYANPERKYAIAMLSCPMSAGNRFHQFANSFVNAMLTNRTILYKYMDFPTCWAHWRGQFQVKNFYSSHSCRATGTEQPCLDMIDLPDWIPRWDDWAPRLDFDLWDAKVIDYWTTESYVHSPAWMKDSVPIKVPISQLRKIDDYPERLVDFPVLVGRYNPKRAIQNTMYATERARSMWPKLWSRGPPYLYGFFFHHLFPLQSKHRITSPQLSDDTLAIAVHSRHAMESYTGEDIDMEVQCLQKVLKHAQGRPCHLCLMSDRPRTIERLHEWVRNETTCTSFSVTHEDVVHSKELEHGPHAGLGFLQELDVCGRSNAFIGNSHGPSSSLMLESLISYYSDSTDFPQCTFHRLMPWEV